MGGKGAETKKVERTPRHLRANYSPCSAISKLAGDGNDRPVKGKGGRKTRTRGQSGRLSVIPSAIRKKGWGERC